jgi:hypothetical protein
MKRAKTTKIEGAASAEPFAAKNNVGNQYLRASIRMLDNNETGTRYQQNRTAIRGRKQHDGIPGDVVER